MYLEGDKWKNWHTRCSDAAIKENKGEEDTKLSTISVSKLLEYVHTALACPKSNLQEKTVIVSHAVDPIIFQYCPYGVLIYTMWGEEAEDKVFEEYKKLRAIK